MSAAFIELLDTVPACGGSIPQGRPESVELISPSIRERIGTDCRGVDLSQCGLEAGDAVRSNSEFTLQSCFRALRVLDELLQAHTRRDEASVRVGGNVSGRLYTLARAPAGVHSRVERSVARLADRLLDLGRPSAETAERRRRVLSCPGLVPHQHKLQPASRAQNGRGYTQPTFVIPLDAAAGCSGIARPFTQAKYGPHRKCGDNCATSERG